MNTRLLSVAAVFSLALAAGEARAQITTVVGPAKRAQVSQQDSVRREQAAQDSVARVTLTDMKQWVDSAASALALRPDTGTVPAETPPTAAPPRKQELQRPDSATTARRLDVAPPEFREGARAPDTATSIPTLAVIGATLVGLGLMVGRRRRVSAEHDRSP